MRGEDTSLLNGTQVTVFTVGIRGAIGIHHHCVYAPFEPIGMVGDAGNGAIRFASTALRIGVLEAPLNFEVGVELSNKERLRAKQQVGR